MSIDKELLPSILLDTKWYMFDIQHGQLVIRNMADRSLMTDLAIMALKKYMDRFVAFEKAKWESQYLKYKELDANDPNLKVDCTFSIDKNLQQFADIKKDIENALKYINEYKKLEPYDFGRHGDIISLFDYPRHLYAPLVRLAQGVNGIKVSPVSLNDDEKKFVDYLYDYTTRQATELEEKKTQIFLLRNKSKEGIGFFAAGNFFPDYILWIDTPGVQYINFIDPKGLMHLTPQDAKIMFHKTIKDLETSISQESIAPKKVFLNSFIMSSTPQGNLQVWWHMKPEEYEALNVYTLDDKDCVNKMMAKILT